MFKAHCRAGSEATNRAAMSFLYVCMYVYIYMWQSQVENEH